MTEEQQLAILEKIPGFVRPSAEWLRGLEVGDRVMAVFVADFNRVGRSGEYIVHNKGEKMFTLYPANGGKKQQVQIKGWHLTAEGRGCGYWLSPIGPYAEQQPAEPPKPFNVGDVIKLTFMEHPVVGISVMTKIKSITVCQGDVCYFPDWAGSVIWANDGDDYTFKNDWFYRVGDAWHVGDFGICKVELV
jgi:hypothetical protein